MLIWTVASTGSSPVRKWSAGIGDVGVESTLGILLWTMVNDFIRGGLRGAKRGQIQVQGGYKFSTNDSALRETTDM